jgi:CheY-like chemotaxis protein
MSDRSNQPPSKAAAAETILVVEPDVLVRMVISDYLRECGYKVFEAIGSEEVMAILKTDSKVDAVLAEVKLEGMDGFELAHWIRSNCPEIEVILTSGPVKAAEKAGDLCDEGPVDKPYHPQQIVRRLKILFERRRQTKS